MKGRVHGILGGVYRVVLDSGREVEASLRGRLKKEDRKEARVVVGDRVEVRLEEGDGATIESVEPRRSRVVRRGPGGRRPKVVAANVDRLVVVAAADRPLPRQRLLDRLLVVGEANELETILVMNKADLRGGRGDGGPGDDGASEVDVASEKRFEALAGLYRRVGYRVMETSAVTDEGLTELREVLCSGTSALVGPSGVGKSSLLNAIEPGLNLRTGELSRRVGRGRHTTVSGRLIHLECGGFVVDTPGFSDAGVWGADARSLERCFPEFRRHSEECRFRRCSHLHEPGCGVREALEAGEIDPGRFESYRTLVEESEASGR